MTVNGAKVDPASNLKTGTHTGDGKGNIVDTSNGSFQQKIFSNQTLPAAVLTIDPRIGDMIATIIRLLECSQGL